jgi:hypothetical protein
MPASHSAESDSIIPHDMPCRRPLRLPYKRPYRLCCIRAGILVDGRQIGLRILLQVSDGHLTTWWSGDGLICGIEKGSGNTHTQRLDDPVRLRLSPAGLTERLCRPANSLNTKTKLAQLELHTHLCTLHVGSPLPPLLDYLLHSSTCTHKTMVWVVVPTVQRDVNGCLSSKHCSPAALLVRTTILLSCHDRHTAPATAVCADGALHDIQHLGIFWQMPAPGPC